MAVCMVFTPPKNLFTKETYEKVMEHLGDAFPPSNMSLHLFGTNDQGECRVVDIFESQEEFEKFAATHAPVYEEMGISLDDLMPHISFFEVEKRLK